MHATEQASTHPAATILTVTYDVTERIITLDVVVSLRPDKTDIDIVAPPVVLPSGLWTLYWELTVVTPGLSATFDEEEGISLPDQPLPKVDIDRTPYRDPESATRFGTRLRSNIQNANAFPYNISVLWSFGPLLDQHKTVHDPTISVTPDPIG